MVVLELGVNDLCKGVKQLLFYNSLRLFQALAYWFKLLYESVHKIILI